MQSIVPNSKVYVQVNPHKNQWTRRIVLNKLKYRKLRVRLENGSIFVRNRRFIKLNKGGRFSHQSCNRDTVPDVSMSKSSDKSKKTVTFCPTFL